MLYTRLASPGAVCIAIRVRYTRLAWLANHYPNPNPTNPSRVSIRLAVCIDTFNLDSKRYGESLCLLIPSVLSLTASLNSVNWLQISGICKSVYSHRMECKYTDKSHYHEQDGSEVQDQELLLLTLLPSWRDMLRDFRRSAVSSARA